MSTGLGHVIDQICAKLFCNLQGVVNQNCPGRDSESNMLPVGAVRLQGFSDALGNSDCNDSLFSDALRNSDWKDCLFII